MPPDICEMWQFVSPFAEGPQDPSLFSLPPSCDGVGNCASLDLRDDLCSPALMLR